MAGVPCLFVHGFRALSTSSYPSNKVSVSCTFKQGLFLCLNERSSLVPSNKVFSCAFKQCLLVCLQRRSARVPSPLGPSRRSPRQSARFVQERQLRPSRKAGHNMEAIGIKVDVPFDSIREQPKSAQSRKRVVIVSRCNPSLSYKPATWTPAWSSWAE